MFFQELGRMAKGTEIYGRERDTIRESGKEVKRFRSNPNDNTKFNFQPKLTYLKTLKCK